MFIRFLHPYASNELLKIIQKSDRSCKKRRLRNREVKISVVPDRDENEKQNGPAVGPVPQSVPKPTISPSKGIVIKIENNSKAVRGNAENNNFRPGLPGIVARPSGRLQTPVTFPPATSSSNTPISVRPDLSAKTEPTVPVQGQTPVGIRVVVQVSQNHTKIYRSLGPFFARFYRMPFFYNIFFRGSKIRYITYNSVYPT